MQQRPWVWIGLAIWAVLYAASIVVPWNTAPTGDSFLRGSNRLILFFQFQIAAGVVGMAVWVFGKQFDRGTWRRWLSRTPALLAVGLVLFIVGIIVVANFRRPAPTDFVPSPDRPVTAPVDQPKPAPTAPAQPLSPTDGN